MEIDITRFRDKIKNFIIYDSDLEYFILSHYSTIKSKQADLYKLCLDRTIHSILGDETDKTGVELFSVIAENDFNNKFMSFMDFINLIITRSVHEINKEYKVVNVTNDDKLILLIEEDKMEV